MQQYEIDGIMPRNIRVAWTETWVWRANMRAIDDEFIIHEGPSRRVAGPEFPRFCLSGIDRMLSRKTYRCWW